MTAETKIRTLASADTALQTYFGAGPFRWFNRILEQGYISQGPCAVATRISTTRMYTQDGLNEMSVPRIQIDVYDLDSQRCSAAATAIIAFMSTVNLASDGAASPPITTDQNPTFLENQRSILEPRTNPRVFREMLEYRMYNLED